MSGGRRLFMLLAGAGAVAGAQGTCRTDSLSARYPAQWVGAQVRQVLVVTANIDRPPGLVGDAMEAVHRTTRATVILNDVGIAAGAPLDSLAVQESVRRLRASGLFSDVQVTGTTCADGVDLTYRTRDAWSLRFDVRLGRRQNRVSLADINVLGSGRTVGVQTDELDDRRAVNVSYIDPWLLGSPFRGAVVLRSYGDGRAWLWGLRTRPVSPLDEWRVQFQGNQTRRKRADPGDPTSIDIDRHSVSAVAQRLVARTSQGVWALLMGGEQERALLHLTGPATALSAPTTTREYTAPVLGMARRSLQYRALDWLVPGQALAELPSGLELEIAAARGVERHSSASLTHLDAWAGWTEMPDAATIVTADAWLGGYWSRDSVDNGTLRGALSVHRSSGTAIWSARLTHERVRNPDPDVFSMTTLDPVLRSLTPSSRLSERATTLTVERSQPLKSFDRVWALHGAVFATFSDRMNTVSETEPPERHLRSVVFGVGIRRIFAQPTIPPMRIDVGRGFFRSSHVPDRWIAIVTVTPWLNAGRGRTGGREIR